MVGWFARFTLRANPPDQKPNVMQSEFLNNVGRPSSRPLLKLSSCVDFFDRDFDTLIVDVENQALRFAWDIAAPGAIRREVRVVLGG